MRVSAKELTALILDEERLRSERNDRKSWKSRVTGIEEFQSNDSPTSPRRPRERTVRPQRADEEDAEYKLAIEASKYQEEEDRKKRASRQGGGEPDDEDLAKAIKLSKEEEELRRRELEEQNAASLFDDDPIQTMQPTGYNQGYQQGGAIDWSGNPIDQQQTGYPNYNQTGFGQQPTGYQNGFPNGFGAQPTGYDAFGGQQPQQQQQQQQPFGAQPTGYNPYGQQQSNFGQDMFGGQPQSQPQQQQQQEQPVAQPGTNNPWATPSASLMAPAPLKATPTGSNNPFASGSSQQANRPSPFATQQKPTLDTLVEQKTLSQFNSPSFNPPTTFTPQQTAVQKPQSEYQSKLGALLESGEGMDTFGNVGNLRIPAQHTAPGTFVNSAGAGMNRIHEQQTGSNPFLQTQFTGMPQAAYGGQQAFGGHQIPAQTGPAYGGQGQSNPFGQRPGQQQGGGDLIQF